MRENRGIMETETIDKLFLELSQVTKAKPGRQLALEHALTEIRREMQVIATIGHTNEYDWNADPKDLTLRVGTIYTLIDRWTQ